MIVFEPFYENYGPDAILAGAKPVFVPLEPPDWRFDPDRLRAAFTSRTKAIIVNTPHNPTGRVFTREELSLIAELCASSNDVWAFTDEIYEHIRYAGNHHLLADVARHARADGHDLGPVEDVQLHRMAPRLRDRAAERNRRRSARCTTS